MLAHEMSHIRNYDVRLMTWAAVLAGLDRDARERLHARAVVRRRRPRRGGGANPHRAGRA